MTSTDPASRHKPWSKQCPSQRWDYLVIGSGIGGMVAAALLARQGQRVLVLERHFEPGGYTHTFSRKGYCWDVGLHAVGEVGPHQEAGQLLSLLTDGALTWHSLGEVYDEFYYPDGFQIGFPDTPARFRRELKAAFPRSHAAIDQYMKLLKGARRAVVARFLARTLPPALGAITDRYMVPQANRYIAMTTAQALDSLTDDRRLQRVLTGQWAYYGAPPATSSFAMHALVAYHYLTGAYYPVGGAGRIARGLLQTVARAGGWTRVAASVSQILLEGGKAVGVRLADGEEIRARRVISAMGVGPTVTRLLPEAERGRAWAREASALPPSCAHVAAYLGFKGDIRRVGATSRDQWHYHDWDLRLSGWRVSADAPVTPAPMVYFCFPSLKDAAHEPGAEQRHTGQILTVVPFAPFARWNDKPWRKRGAEYDAFKQRLQEALLGQLYEAFPGIEPLVDYVELSTPVSTNTFCDAVDGAMYGPMPTPARFTNRWLRPRSPIPGLLFAGNDVASPGIIGAAMGGVVCALSAAPAGTLRLLAKM